MTLPSPCFYAKDYVALAQVVNLAVPIVGLIESCGTAMHKPARTVADWSLHRYCIGRSPFVDDGSEIFANIDMNAWFCQGLQKGGDASRFLQDRMGISAKMAILTLYHRAGLLDDRRRQLAIAHADSAGDCMMGDIFIWRGLRRDGGPTYNDTYYVHPYNEPMRAQEADPGCLTFVPESEEEDFLKDPEKWVETVHSPC